MDHHLERLGTISVTRTVNFLRPMAALVCECVGVSHAGNNNNEDMESSMAVSRDRTAPRLLHPQSTSCYALLPLRGRPSFKVNGAHISDFATLPHFSGSHISPRAQSSTKMSMLVGEADRSREPRPVPDSTPSNVLDQFSLKGMVVVVNGAAHGIGYAVILAEGRNPMGRQLPDNLRPSGLTPAHREVPPEAKIESLSAGNIIDINIEKPYRR